MLRKKCYIGKNASFFSPEEELRGSRRAGTYKAMEKLLESPGIRPAAAWSLQHPATPAMQPPAALLSSSSC